MVVVCSFIKYGVNVFLLSLQGYDVLMLVIFYVGGNVWLNFE